MSITTLANIRHYSLIKLYTLTLFLKLLGLKRAIAHKYRLIRSVLNLSFSAIGICVTRLLASTVQSGTGNNNTRSMSTKAKYCHYGIEHILEGVHTFLVLRFFSPFLKL